MARFYGKVIYATSVETAPGVWTDDLTERTYTGEVIKNTKRWVSGDKVNDDLSVNNEISIVADPFAYDNFHNIKAVEWMGVKWKVINISIIRPRLTLTLGGIFNV